MFTQPHSITPRHLFSAGFVSLAVLGAATAPAAAQSGTPERALLNVEPARYQAAASADKPVVDGEQALLARSSFQVPEAAVAVTHSQLEARAIDGERALLGIQTQSSRRGLTLAW